MCEWCFVCVCGRVDLRVCVLCECVCACVACLVWFCPVSRAELARRAAFQNLCLIPGGIAEMLLSSRAREVRFLKKRQVCIESEI